MLLTETANMCVMRVTYYPEIHKPQATNRKENEKVYFYDRFLLKAGQIWSKLNPNFKIFAWTSSNPLGTVRHRSGIDPLIYAWTLQVKKVSIVSIFFLQVSHLLPAYLTLRYSRDTTPFPKTMTNPGEAPLSPRN